jgi:hypothetical protein
MNGFRFHECRNFSMREIAGAVVALVKATTNILICKGARVSLGRQTSSGLIVNQSHQPGPSRRKSTLGDKGFGTARSTCVGRFSLSGDASIVEAASVGRGPLDGLSLRTVCGRERGRNSFETCRSQDSYPKYRMRRPKD